MVTVNATFHGLLNARTFFLNKANPLLATIS